MHRLLLSSVLALTLAACDSAGTAPPVSADSTTLCDRDVVDKSNTPVSGASSNSISSFREVWGTTCSQSGYFAVHTEFVGSQGPNGEPATVTAKAYVNGTLVDSGSGASGPTSPAWVELNMGGPIYLNANDVIRFDFTHTVTVGGTPHTESYSVYQYN